MLGTSAYRDFQAVGMPRLDAWLPAETLSRAYNLNQARSESSEGIYSLDAFNEGKTHLSNTDAFV